MYLSEAIKNSLEINETDKEVTLLVSCRGRNAFDGGVLSVPIAGFFSAPEKDYKTEIREYEKNLLLVVFDVYHFFMFRNIT